MPSLPSGEGPGIFSCESRMLGCTSMPLIGMHWAVQRTVDMEFLAALVLNIPRWGGMPFTRSRRDLHFTVQRLPRRTNYDTGSRGFQRCTVILEARHAGMLSSGKASKSHAYDERN